MVEASEKPSDITPANVADEAVGVPDATNSPCTEAPKHWYVAYVGTRAEKAVRNRLMDEGIEAYAATQNLIRVRPSGRRVEIETPVITQYIFVHVTEQMRKVIVSYPYIHSFLTNKATKTNDFGRHELAIIPDEQMKVLQNMLQQTNSRVLFATTGFTVGEQVRVLGWGEDVRGQIIRIRGDRNQYIGIRLDQLGCAFMEITPDKLMKLI